MKIGDTYGDLLLRDNYSTVLSPDSDRCDVCGGNGFECILLKLVSLGVPLGELVLITNRLGRGDLDPRRW